MPDDAATNFDPPYPAVQIYQVAGASPVATVQPAAGTLRVYGAPESLLTLADAGLLAERPGAHQRRRRGPARVRVDPDRLAAPPGQELRRAPHVLLAHADRHPARQHVRGRRRLHRTRLDPPTPSVARYSGIKNVTASSSASDIQANPGPVGERAAALRRGRRRHRGPCGSPAAGPARSASGSRSTSMPGSPGHHPGGVRRQPRDRAAGQPGHGADRRGPPSATRCRSPAIRSRCGCPRARPAGCGSRSPAWPRRPSR